MKTQPDLFLMLDISFSIYTVFMKQNIHYCLYSLSVSLLLSTFIHKSTDKLRKAKTALIVVGFITVGTPSCATKIHSEA